MCAHGTSAAGACSSTARLLQLGSQARMCLSSRQLQDLRLALQRLAAAVMWRNGEQLVPLGNTVFTECVDTYDAPTMIITVPSIDKNRDGIPDVTQSGAATTINPDSQGIGLLQDLRTKVMADVGAELTIKLDSQGTGLLQDLHTKGMAGDAAEVEASEAFSQRSNEQAQDDGHWKEALTSNIASTRVVIEEDTAKFESMAVPSEDTYRGGMRQVACPKCGCSTTCVEDACDECGVYSHIRECAPVMRA